ncbi:hypothetical protein [Pseudorhodoferax sp. Leaf265]|uniref:hypothetical protein n=1 Tax=Pseudorhodoferax sp. Leaf265 TaxID=1736315 RepID=UPI0006F402DE|nr:hypothetical protein ASF45_12265 [Pseudorhodoferax sp. Leaf265]
MSGSNLSDVPPFGASRAMAEADQPLGLTVHSLPSPAEAEAAGEAAQRTRSGRLKMLLVVLVCAAPVIASYFTYYVVRPEGRSVFGELIDPQRPLPDLPAVGLDGQTLRLPSLKGQWLLVSVAGGDCDAACERNLYLQRQLRESLGKEKERVDWVWLVDDGAPVRETLRPALQSATVLRVDRAGLAQWLTPAAGQALPAHLYIVDPMGNWMMRLPPALDAASAAKAKRDIERLLRASNSWDNAGR